ncbi:MAG: hypothetical protein NVSMB27_22760 [Ktedonobacteraceae bacterium]
METISETLLAEAETGPWVEMSTNLTTEEIQFHYIQEQYRHDRKVPRVTMKIIYERFDFPFDKAEAEEFADSMGHWKPFPDSRDAILELQKFLKVVLTSSDSYLL